MTIALILPGVTLVSRPMHQNSLGVVNSGMLLRHIPDDSCKILHDDAIAFNVMVGSTQSCIRG
jgi:hypothetical protein